MHSCGYRTALPMSRSTALDSLFARRAHRGWTGDRHCERRPNRPMADNEVHGRSRSPAIRGPQHPGDRCFLGSRRRQCSALRRGRWPGLRRLARPGRSSPRSPRRATGSRVRSGSAPWTSTCTTRGMSSSRRRRRRGIRPARRAGEQRREARLPDHHRGHRGAVGPGPRTSISAGRSSCARRRSLTCWRLRATSSMSPRSPASSGRPTRPPTPPPSTASSDSPRRWRSSTWTRRWG